MTMPRDPADRPDLAVYWFGNWHVDPRHSVEISGRPDWTEWDVVRAAVPRFPGHQQPIEPLWGYVDDTDPLYQARAHAAAVEAGIDAFIVDWYWYDGPFLERPLDDVMIGIDSPLKFALMWANVDWVDCFPAKRDQGFRLIAPSAVTPEGFAEVAQHTINRYMTLPRYWRVDGAAYYSIYNLDNFVAWMGGIAGARAALDDFRARARASGVGELHLAAISGGFTGYTPGDLAALGFDSVTGYNACHLLADDEPTKPYATWRAEMEAERDDLEARYEVPWLPTVCAGWDSTPRTEVDQKFYGSIWPYHTVVVDNTPEELEAATRDALDWVAERDIPQYVTFNAWNEWTEGSYLEPDVQWGTSKLDAVRRATGGRRA